MVKNMGMETKTNISAQLLRKYIRRYVLFLLILLLVLVPVYYAVYSTTKKMVIGEVYNRLQISVNEMDYRITGMRSITDIIRENMYVEQIAKIQGSPGIEESYAMIKAKDAIALDLMLGKEEGNVSFVFRDNPIVISDQTVLSDPTCQDYSAYVPKGWEFDEWKEWIFDSKKIIRYLPVQNFLSALEEGILCVVNGFNMMNGKTDMAAVFYIDVNMWQNVLGNGRENDDNFLCVTDTIGNVLYEKNGMGKVPVFDGEGQKEINWNGEDYTVLSMSTPINGLRVSVGISRQSILASISEVNGVLWVYATVAGIGMAVMVVWYAIRKAIRMRTIMDNLNQEGKFKGNEYDFISRAVRGIRQENNRYLRQMEEMKGDIRNGMLDRLLTRGIYTRQGMEQVEKYLKWNMEFYCVVCVYGKQEEKEYLKEFLLLDQFLQESFWCISVNMGISEQAYVIGLEGNEAPDTGRIVVALEKVIAEGLDVSVGVSSIGTGLKNLHRCYDQAVRAVRNTGEKISVRKFEAEEQMPGKSGFRGEIFHQNLDTQLADLLLAGEKTSVCSLFQKIMRSMERFADLSKQDIMELYFSVQAPILRTWEELNMNGKLPEYSDRKTVEELLQELKEVAYRICDHILAGKEDGIRNRNQKLISFADTHYMNSAMCVAYMAQQFHMSEKYFISCFKEATGRNFSAYIETKRLKLAEHYLLGTDESMYHVAELVGYNTVDAFYKSFKKKYGMPPGRWKEQRKQEK